MARSEYIRVMIESGMMEGKTGIVRVRDTSEQAFTVFLEFLYTCKLQPYACFGLDWEELYNLADLFRCEPLQLMLANAVTWKNVRVAALIAVEKGLDGGSAVQRMLLACAESIPERASGAEDAETIIIVANLLNSQYPDVLDDSEILYSLLGPVASAMKELPYIEHVQETGCNILAFGADRYSPNEGVHAFPVIDVVLSALRQYRDNARIQEDGCCALNNILEDYVEEKIAYAFANGAVEAVLDAMKRHSTNGSVQCNASNALVTVTDDPARMKTAISTELGAMDLLASAVKAHAHDADVLVAVLNALGDIAAGTPCGWGGMREQAIASGVTSSVVQAMRAHEGNEDVQISGTVALNKLLEPYQEPMSVDELDPLTGMGPDQFVTFEQKQEIVEAVMNAMDLYPASSMLQIDCIECCKRFMCIITRTHAQADSLSPSIHGSKYVAALLAAMSANVNDYELQDECCHALSRLGASLGPAYKDLALRNGAIEAIVRALNNHPTDVNVIDSGFEALMDCGADWDNRVVQAGAVQAFLTIVNLDPYIFSTRSRSS